MGTVEQSRAADQLAAEYTDKASAYDDHWAPVLHNFSIRLLGSLPLQGVDTVLEVGCGTGGLLAELAESAKSAQVVGVDRSTGMLMRAKRNKFSPLAVMDAGSLGIVDGSFDLVVCAFVLFHVTDPGRALEEFFRVLRPGGCIGLVVWGEDQGSPGQKIWNEELDARGATPDPRPAGVMNQSMMNTQEKLSSLLYAAGFSSIRTWAERFEHKWTVDGLLALQVGCGAPSRRLCSLPQRTRDACQGSVAERLARLTQDELVYRPEVLYAVAHRRGIV